MNKTLVIWDWDNTLANTKPSVIKGLNETMAHFGLPKVTRKDVINVMTRHRGEFWTSRFSLDKKDGRPSVEEAIDYYVSCYQKYSAETVLYPHVRDILMFLKEYNIPQVIVSNKNHEALVQEVKDKKVFSYFYKVRGTSGPLGKPEKAFVQDILDEIKPDKIIVLGDGESDMLLARNLGAISILVHTSGTDLPAVYRAHSMFEAGILLTEALHIK